MYTKADKGNKVVILDCDDYDNKVKKLIDDCSYKKVKRNPLPKMISESDETRKIVSDLFGKRLLRSLLVSNPKVAKMYALPKIHKGDGDSMRPIVASFETPSYKLAKWLVKEIKCLPQFDSLSVKNSFDFVNKVKDVSLTDNEVLVSFDVTSLFPNIPVECALIEFEKYLEKLNLQEEKKKVYVRVAKTCMNQNFFQFRDSIYKVEKGTNMGNPLSPLISEVFMASFEMSLKNRGLLPRVWLRYVDDLFAVVETNEISNVLEVLNNQFETIKFTHEEEKENILPFLDLELKRVNRKIEIGVHHKPTSTQRVITSDSNCAIQHKEAAFHSMCHHLCRLPLNAENFRKEYMYIKDVAKKNGYSEIFVDRIVKKHSNKVTRSNLSTHFSQIQTNEKKKVAFNFIPAVTNKLKQKLREYDMQMVFKSQYKLSALLGSNKDKTPALQKSGVYRIKCSVCDAAYIGQTKRNIEKRYKEHCRCVKFNRPHLSAVAAHILENEHSINIDNISLVKQVNDERQLDAWESFYISIERDAMNQDEGNIQSCLFALAK